MENFKPIVKGETLTLEGGYMTNGKWCFQADWLESFPNASNLEIRKRIRETKLALVEARLAGKDVVRRGVAEVVRAVKLEDFRAVSLSEARAHKGYRHGKATEKTTVAMILAGGSKGSAALDADFYPALTWDSETVVMVRDSKTPIVLVKAGEIVGLLSPMKI